MTTTQLFIKMATVNDQNLYYGLNSVLDFQLYFILEGVIKGKDSPGTLIRRYEELQKNALDRGEYGEYLVTFIDNHDQIGDAFKNRFGYDAQPQQIIAGIAFLLCALGTPCIYYGTEQGLNGCGKGDNYIRERLFNPNDKTTNLLNQKFEIYRSIAAIAKYRNESNVLRFGRMFIREISNEGKNFHLPECNQCILAFSRVLYNQEVVFIYNTSNADVRNEYILIDHHLNKNHKWLTPVYGYTSNVEIHHSEDPANPVSYIKLYLIKIILEKIEDRLYPGISTKKIYQTAFKLLRKQSKPIAARYKLKSAIMELGPSGFPFEKYVAAILQHQGYKVQTSVMVQGKCVKHEVDVIAEKAEHHIKLHQGWVVTNTRFTTDAIQYGDCAGQ